MALLVRWRLYGKLHIKQHSAGSTTLKSATIDANKDFISVLEDTSAPDPAVIHLIDTSTAGIWSGAVAYRGPICREDSPCLPTFVHCTKVMQTKFNGARFGFKLCFWYANWLFVCAFL